MKKLLPLKFILFGLLGLSLQHAEAQTTTATVSTYAGTNWSGSIDGYTTNGASFSQIKSVAVDASGNVYVADTYNHQIRKITTAGQVTTLAGSTTAGSNDGTGALAGFNQPNGVAVDGSGNVYVADTENHKIRKITSAGVVTTFAGSGTSGNTNGTGALAKFNFPSGVAVDGSGNLYVADRGNHKIRKISPSGDVTTLAGSGTAGSTDATGTAASFNSPSKVALDASGNLYVADGNNHSIRKITSAGVVTTLAGSGTYNFADGTGTQASFKGPYGIAVDASGNVYVADAGSQRIRKISPAGVVTTLAGSDNMGRKDAMGTSATFNFPMDVALDASENIYVADADNRVVRKVTPAGNVTTYAGIGTNGSSNGNALVATFNYPYGVAADGSGNIYVADRNNHKIRKITPAGIVSTLAGSGSQGNTDGTGTAASFMYPTGVAVDGSGNVYVADNGNYVIRKITPAGVVSTLAGSGTSGFADGTGTQARFNNPYGVAVDGSGNVYVADTWNHRIRKITPAGVVTTLAGSGTSGSADGTGASAGFNFPYGVAVDGAGNVYVADANNYKIRKITSAGMVTTVAGSIFGDMDGEATQARFKFPNGVAIDGSGNIYVADQSSYKIRMVSSNGVVSTLAGTGTWGSTDGNGTEAGFNYPSGVCLDASGNLFVADQSNNRIRKITITTTTGVFSGQEYNILSLYPNPTQNELHIDVEGTKNIRIVDAMGKVVMEQEINSNQLSVAHLPKGIYAVVVEQQGKKYVSRLAKE